MMKKNGTGYLTMCESCQREYWRDSKVKRHANKPAETSRICKTCGEEKPIEDFPKNGKYRKRSCKSCYSSLVAHKRTGRKPKTKRATKTVTPVTSQRERILLIDPVTNRHILCEVMSERPVKPSTSVHMRKVYRAQGVEIEKVRSGE